MFSSPKRSEWRWGPPSPLLNVYRGPVTVVSGRGVNPTSYLQPVPRLSMNGAVARIPLALSWNGEGLYLYEEGQMQTFGAVVIHRALKSEPTTTKRQDKAFI